MLQPPLEHLSAADRDKLVVALARFERAWQEQTRRDDAILAALVRALRRDGTEVDQFRQLLFQQEDSSKMLSVAITESGRPVQITCTP